MTKDKPLDRGKHSIVSSERHLDSFLAYPSRKGSLLNDPEVKMFIEQTELFFESFRKKVAYYESKPQKGRRNKYRVRRVKYTNL